MDDLFDPLEEKGQSEIDKIQAEIDKVLNESNKPLDDSIDSSKDENMVTGEVVNQNQGIREVTESTYTEYKEPVQNINDNSFIKETIKSDKNARGNKSFGRFVAVVCIVSILGGSSIGAMIPITRELIIPSITKEKTRDTQENGNFTFENGEKTEVVKEGSQETANSYFSSNISFADLVKKVEPSVVCITSSVVGENTLFYMQGVIPNQGSGIIFDEDNENIYIVSNNHVTKNAQSVEVSVEKSENVTAKLVGKEAQSDLVVLSVSKKDLKEKGIEQVTVAKFGKSSQMRVGDFAIAIGNALGEGNIATFGFISAIDKDVSVEDRVLTVIQTDAAINPGNSGGPLINLNGEVIGINTLKLSETSVEGMGYSITSDVAMPIIEQLRNKTPKPVLGIVGGTITDKIAQAYNLPEIGVIISEVAKDSAADKAGLKRTDVITSFNGQPVFTMEDLQEKIQGSKVGDEVEIMVIRQGVEEPMKFKCKLAEIKDDNF